MTKKKKKAPPVISVSHPDLKLTEDQIEALREKFASAAVDVLEKGVTVPHFEFFADRPSRKGR